MKIVNRKQFLALPNGTLYAKYAPCYMEDICIKEDSLPDDFTYQSIADAIKCDSGGDFGDLLQLAELTGRSVPMDFDCCGRDGCFDKDQLFAVYEPNDVKALIARLQQALIDSKG